MPPADPPLKPYDTLLVNGYISNGFAPSGLDAFFPSPATEGSPVPEDAEMKSQDSFEEVASVALMALKRLQTEKSARKVSIPNVFVGPRLKGPFRTAIPSKGSGGRCSPDQLPSH
jgi:hypothetical protein